MELVDEQLHFWLQKTFQNSLESALQLSANPAPEETPYVYKYEAIERLKTLLEKPHPYHFIPLTTLGQIYSEVEQTSDSVKSYEKALHSLSELDPKEVYKFHNYLIVIYNLLGLSYVNREEVDQGMGCLSKAAEIYENFKEIKTVDVYNNRSEEAKGRKFQCYYQGGFNHDQMEQSFTLTLFYLAQTYTKLGFKEKAAEHCGRTLQRQYATDKYEINDFCHNLIGLSEFYQGNHLYSQSQYLLLLGLKILPEGKKKKMRATVQKTLGNMLLHMLQYCIGEIKKGNPLGEKDNESTNREFLTFDGFTQAFPKITLANDLQACKGFFRLANTQFKKSLQVFVLDGYVTEHIEILHSQSRLYWNLCRLDKSRERVVSMIEKRREMLEPLLTELNPKAFPATWQKILVEIQQIYSDLFQLKTIMVIDVKEGKPINEPKLEVARQVGNKLIEYYEEIIKTLENDTEAEKNAQYYRSLINAKFNIAKSLSKMYSNDRKIRVQFLKKSWTKYKEVSEYITQTAMPKGQFDQQYEMTQDMVKMMPNKIDRINYGQVSPFE